MEVEYELTRAAWLPQAALTPERADVASHDKDLANDPISPSSEG